MARGESTTLIRATSRSDSLRTTVPKSIVNMFDLNEGGRLRWIIKPSKNGKHLIIIVEPEVCCGRK